MAEEHGGNSRFMDTFSLPEMGQSPRSDPTPAGEPTAPAGDGTVVRLSGCASILRVKWQVGLEVKPYPVHDAEPAHPDSLQLHADSLPAQADSSPAYAASSPAGALSPRERAGTGAQPLGGPQGGARGHSSSTISNNDFDTRSPFE